MKLKTTIFLLAFFTTITHILAQEVALDASNIKTVVVKPNVVNYYAPIIKMGESLSITFDDLNADMQDYTYQITHCNADWTPSNLNETEYIIGYASDRIREFETSLNTLQDYVNYSFVLPNQNTRFKITGNYLVSVLNEDEEVVFTRKFIIYQDQVTVDATVHRGRNVFSRDQTQSVQFSINHPNLLLTNPSVEITPVVLQNNDWKTAIYGLKPQFIRGDQLLYKYDKETSFQAGNEFLFFDTKNIRTAGSNIHSIRQGEDIYETFLYTDEPRGIAPYSFTEDVNGNFVVRILNGDESNVEADYTKVHFTLQASEATKNKTIYINGNFNNWQLNDANKMTYNPKNNMFEATIILKQGFYNYEYVTLENNKFDRSQIDGSFFQTENNYTILVYYRKLGSRFANVIGVGRASSLNIMN